MQKYCIFGSMQDCKFGYTDIGGFSTASLIKYHNKKIARLGDFLLHIRLKERFQFVERYFVRAVI